MSVLLQNTEKPAKREAFVGVGYALDISKLDVCFGGFTPMALSDGVASRDQVEESERRMQAHRASRERAAAIEAARASEQREWTDDTGSLWRYVVLDDTEIRIDRCETETVLLNIPAEIDTKPVVALAPDACAYLSSVEHIVCPDSIVLIGPSAFRFDTALQSIVFPHDLATFDSGWLRGCLRIERLVLPGRLARLDASIFDVPALRTLVVGAGAGEIMPGAFAKSNLETIEVDASNPFLMTDGRALYSRDGSVLAALAVPGESYCILEGCKAIAKKGFSTFSCIQSVEVPEGLEVLGDFALSRTSITRFDAPASLRRIGEKAFFNCALLTEVCLPEGLVSVADNAFSGTALRSLHLPSTVEKLGNPIAAKANLLYAGPDATFSIADGPSAHLTLDEAGGLYREDERGAHLVRMMDPNASFYEVRPGTVTVDAAAFVNHASITEVVLPEGLEEVGEGAFKACRSLKRIALPTSLRRIDNDAFLDAGLESLCLPPSLEYVGINALVSYGAHHGDTAPSLHKVEVAEGNERFFTESGLLLERKEGGSARVLLCTGTVDVVRIPACVDEIAPYAFNDVVGIRELYLSDRIKAVGIRGLGISGLLELIHIDLVEPIGEHDSFDVRFPDTDRGAQQMMLALSVPDHVDVAILFEHYDNAVVNGSSFDAQSARCLSMYEQSTRIVARLADPVFLTQVNRSMCERFLRTNIEDVCVAAARHDDRRMIDALMDLGFLNADNLLRVIDRIGAVQDASMTGYLLEAKRLRFNQDALDFDL